MALVKKQSRKLVMDVLATLFIFFVLSLSSFSRAYAEFQVDPRPLVSGRLALSVSMKDRIAIYIFDFEELKMLSLAEERLVDSPSWAPDGSALAYSSGSRESRRAIFIYDGDVTTRLTSGNTLDTDPQWFPNSKLLSFVRKSGNSPRSLWIVGRDGSGEERFYTAKAEVFLARPSPRGTELLIVTDTDWPGKDILSLPLRDNARPRLLTAGSLNHDQPSWHPDGRSFLMTVGRAPETDLAIAKLKNKSDQEETLLEPLDYPFREPGSERGAVWHHSLNRILFIKDLSPQGSEVRIYDRDKAESRTVIRCSHKIEGLSWTGTRSPRVAKGESFRFSTLDEGGR